MRRIRIWPGRIRPIICTGLLKAVRAAVRSAKQQSDFRAEQVVGIGVDTTGSTPIPVDRQGVPLAQQPRFAKHLAAQAWLWKDHTSASEAAEITQKAARVKDNYLAKCGGVYSSEWYWSKILHCRRTAPAVFEAAHSWVELADYIPALITGNTDPERLSRGICAAGHKAMYHESWGGLPSKAFLRRLDPDLAKVAEHYATAGGCRRSTGGSVDGRSGQAGGIARRPAGRRRGLRRAHGSGRSRRQAGHAGQDHRHQYLRHHGLAPGSATAGHSGLVRHRSRIGDSRDVRPGSGTVRRGRYLQLVCPAPDARRVQDG